MSDTVAGPGEPLLVERTAGIWFACLNRPDTHNALTDGIVGAGGNFCAGVDFAGFLELLTSAPGHSEDPIARYNRHYGALLEQVATLPAPTIAVVTGAAIGGGCGLAAACGRVIAAEDAAFATPEVTLGAAPAQIAPFVVRRFGAARGRWLMLATERLPAPAELGAGLADLVVPAGALRAALAADLHMLDAAEPAALSATKRVVALASTAPLPTALDTAALEFAGLLRRGDVREDVAAAREKRAPAWRAPVPKLPGFL